MAEVKEGDYPPPYAFAVPFEGKACPAYSITGEEVENQLNGVIHHAAAFAHVEFCLAENSVISDGGAMIWKDANVEMETLMGECAPSCWRRCAGESCCQNKFTGPGKIAFSFKLPGDMKMFALTSEQGWKLSAGAFVCGTENCVVSTQFTGCYAMICGGEEAWLTKVTVEDGDGAFYAGGYGAITAHDVPEGNTVCMSSGAFFASPSEHPFELRMPGGILSCQFGGEGLVMAMTGPVKLYTQNRNPSIWKTILRREGPKQGKQGVDQ